MFKIILVSLSNITSMSPLREHAFHISRFLNGHINYFMIDFIKKSKKTLTSFMLPT